MPNMCSICNSPNRAEIEDAILNMSAGASPVTLDSIAERFDVSVEDLKMHALFHTPMISVREAAVLKGNSKSNEEEDPRDSLTRQMKLREADMLAAVGNEYLVTLKTMGRRINRLAQVSDIDVEDQEKQMRLAKLLTKPMVDLYVGVGSEIRQTVKTMAEINRLLNGPEDNSTAGLAALATAIRASDKLAQNGDE